MNENDGKSIIASALRNGFMSENSSKKLKESEERYHLIRKQLEAAKATESSVLVDSGYDWTQIYKFNDKYIDIEDLERQQSQAEKQISDLEDYQSNFLGHSHDHRKEKEIFDLTIKEKLALCERYLILAMSMESEMHRSKAAELYSVALSYSEYVFPDSEAESASLQAVRYTILMNLANIHCSSKQISEALHFAELSLKETSEKHLLAKTFSLMGKIYQSSYEYSLAAEQYSKAMSFGGNAEELQNKILALKAEENLAKINDKRFAESAFRQKAAEDIVGGKNEYEDLIVDISMPIEPSIQSL